MGNRVMISQLHKLEPVAYRFQAEKRAEKWRIGYDADQLRNRTLRYMGKDKTSHAAWQASNAGISYTRWTLWIAGEKLPGKYHMALDRFLTEQGV